MASRARSRPYASVLVAIIRLVRCLVDTHQTGMIGVASRHRMVFELAEMPREGDVFGAREILVAEEQDLVLEKQSSNLCHETRVT